ncbi:MAG: UDP-N-acetylglucosamine 2-epimerase (non-hydrolyzing) [Chloroflexi bacterium]|nr:UDP-N-acetylglucosamine 2-epimerase (non-hydrolyzing) [Chloroflexota bacterium]
MIKVVAVFGTRPEAVKLAPVILDLRQHPDRLRTVVCVTAQHRQMLDQVLRLFDIVPDVDLDVMLPDQALPALTARVITQVSDVLERESPDLVLVHGDTTTAMAAALAAFYQRIPVGHVEAGLRTHDRYAPFPEEINRRVAGVLATYHFAPTETARRALLCEGVNESSVFVTGNPVIDALHLIVRRPQPALARELLARVGRRRLILVTAHRRENFGERFVQICHGIKALAERNPDIAIFYPVHLNPHVQEPVYRLLAGVERVYLTNPVEYDTFVHLMNASTLVLTDSGGLQEEAPALGKPVLVMRTETERPEAVEAGTVKLVGPNADRIVQETERLLGDVAAYDRMARAVSPYGDGHAAERIVRIILENLDHD